MKNVRVMLFLIFLMFAVCFAIPPFMMMEDVLAIPRYIDIVENGIETTATIDPDSYQSNLTVNEVEYYSVGYMFLDQNGEEHYARTPQDYTRTQVMKLKTIQIKYDPETFESVNADFDWTKSQGLKSSLIFVVVFGLADLIFWIVEIVFIIKFIKIGIVSIKGKQFTAKFVTIKPGAKYNDVQMYRVIYTWTNENGEVCEGDSGDDYTLTEAHAFELAGEFKILGFKNLSKIVSKPSRIIVKQAKEEQVTTENYYVCPYCTSMLPHDTLKCPSCGAPRKEVK